MEEEKGGNDATESNSTNKRRKDTEERERERGGGDGGDGAQPPLPPPPPPPLPPPPPPPPTQSLQHVKHSWYEKEKDLVVVAVYIRKIEKETLKIDFGRQDFVLNFQTKDNKFLNLHPNGNGETFFSWTVNLKDKIISEKCSYTVSDQLLNITLKKSDPKRWGVLEAPQKETQGITLPSNTWLPASPAPNTKEDEEESIRNKGDGDGDGAETILGDASSVVANDTGTKKKPTCMVSPLNKMKPENQTVSLGMTGLENLGNTCFMNSVLQCLVNTQEFREYFLGSHFQSEINTENPLGTGGKLAIAFATLMRTLWSGTHKSYSPSKLKNLISLKANQFTGFLQHDAQEFMAFLLDGLHEDLNRIKEKPYTPNSSHDNSETLPDEVAANAAWQLYKRRNDSIVVDLFQGQYKSKLVCPVCSKVSITFDPFLYLSVPLPKKQRVLPVIFFARDPSRRPVKYYVRLSHNTLAGELFDELGKLTSVSPSNLRIFEVAKSKVQKFLTPSTSLDTITANSLIFACEVLEANLAGEPVLELVIMHRIATPRPVTKCCHCRKEAPPNMKLKRCTNCYRVGYCDQACQRNHWSVHKSNCKLTPELIGYPVMVCLPKSQATYSKLCYLIEAFARYTVDVFQPPIIRHPIGCSNAAKSSSIAASCDSRSTATTCEEGLLPISEQQSDNNSEDIITGLNAVTTRAVYGQPQEKIGERSTQPFTIRCVGQSGQNLSGDPDTDKLEDLGEEPLELMTRFLAVDWNNNEKLKNYVLVQSKDLEFDLDEDKSHGLRYEQSNFTLEQCLQLFTEPEKLTRDEAWYCPKCKEHREATKEISLWRLPPILIVQLKRFSFKNLILRDKIDKAVEFPIHDLDLSSYCCSGSIYGNDGCEIPNAIYDLYAVINHHGTILGGHYTAVARLVSIMNTRRSDAEWRLFDDSRVSFVASNRVMTPAGYVLFYRRRDSTFELSNPQDDIISSASANTIEENENLVSKVEETNATKKTSLVALQGGDFNRPLMVSVFSEVDTVD